MNDVSTVRVATLEPHRQQEYLDRIGADRPTRPDAAALTELMRRHLRSVPFENLSVHLDEGVRLEPDALLHKIVDRRRGGICYELNAAFAALLSGLGYRVELLEARVHEEGRFGEHFDHLALRVWAPADGSGPWLVDVGFGSFVDGPLDLLGTEEQTDPLGVFRIVATGPREREVRLVRAPEGLAVPDDDEPDRPPEEGATATGSDAAGESTGAASATAAATATPTAATEADGSPEGPEGPDAVPGEQGRPFYRLTTPARELPDFLARCHYLTTSPESWFTRRLMCSVSGEVPGDRLTLTERVLKRTAGGRRTQAGFDSAEAVLAAYRRYFGLVLDREPRVAAADPAPADQSSRSNQPS